MRKINPIRTQSDNSQTTEPLLRSWVPETSCPTVALDPAQWSRRGRQILYWRLIEAWPLNHRLH